MDTYNVAVKPKSHPSSSKHCLDYLIMIIVYKHVYYIEWSETGQQLGHLTILQSRIYAADMTKM